MKYILSSNPFGGVTQRLLKEALEDIDERLNNIEKKVFKTSRVPTTLAQQILILHKLGLLDKIKKMDMSNNQKAKLLSILLNGDIDNTEHYLSHSEDNDAVVHTATNYKFLTKLFKEVELSDLEKKADNELTKLLKEK
jgi:hypothetical protein